MIKIKPEPRLEKNIRVFFDAETFSELERQSVLFDVSMSGLIRAIVKQALAQGELQPSGGS